MRVTGWLLLGGALVLGSTCVAEDAAKAVEKPQAAVGLDLAGMDRSVAAGDDFFGFANGTWLKQAVIPPDRASVGTFADVYESTLARTSEIIRDATRAEPGSEARKVGDFYSALMDEATIDERGLAPLKPTFERIAAIADRQALARFLGGTLRADVDAINATSLDTPNVLGLWVAQDMDAPDRYTAFLLQGGLDMPDRAYYLDPAPRMVELREKLQTHVAAVLSLAGFDDTASRAQAVVALETRLAEAHASREDSGDVKKGNTHWSRKDFERKAPGLDWTEFFAAAGLADQAQFVVWQPSAVVGLAALAGSQPLAAWQDYLRFHAADSAASVLPSRFMDESFAFHGKAVAGVQQLRERHKRSVAATSRALGHPVGKLYVARFFPPEHKARIEQMVANLMKAFGRRIDALEWMTPQTRARAKAKLAVLKVGVGYPDRWRDCSALEIRADDAYGNAQRVGLFELKENLAKLGQPVDRGEWVMNPQTVNAVNLPVMNAMNFPAAFLQPPYFDPARPVAMDYGAIGAVIGHEVSHSFDDQGAQFDETGRMANWWTEADQTHFEQAADRLVAQYDAYRPYPDLAANGRLTLGENIADVAGLAAAYDAYRMSLGGEAAPVVEDLSGDQQFFIAYAQAWRAKMREQAERMSVIGNGHSLGRYRAATVRNLDAWYAAFDVKPDQALFLAPADRVRIW